MISSPLARGIEGLGDRGQRHGKAGSKVGIVDSHDREVVGHAQARRHPRGAKHPAEAWEFTKFLCVNKESQVVLGATFGRIPALKAAAYDDRVLALNPLMKTFIDMLPEARFRPVLPAGEELYALYLTEVDAQLVAVGRSSAGILRETAVAGQKALDRAWARIGSGQTDGLGACRCAGAGRLLLGSALQPRPRVLQPEFTQVHGADSRGVECGQVA